MTNLDLNDLIALTVANQYGFNRRSVRIDWNRGTVYAGSNYCGRVSDDRLTLNREGFEPATFILDRINPIVRETALSRYPGWTVREYANGVFDASGRSALSPGYDTFAEAVGFARRDGASA